MTFRTRALTAFMARTLTAATIARAAAMTTLLAAGTAAHAHTGHGHDGLSTFQGLLHALREPDHLVMIALGVIVIGATSPFVLRAATWLGRRAAAAVRHTLAAKPGVKG